MALEFEKKNKLQMFENNNNNNVWTKDGSSGKFRILHDKEAWWIVQVTKFR
jgi:hypothetical protein